MMSPRIKIPRGFKGSILAKIPNKYSDTNILIEGHTDDTGSERLLEPS